MIDGALPALDVLPGLAPAPAGPAGDPAAAELFATLVAQLLGQPAPAAATPVDARVAAPVPAPPAPPPAASSAATAPVASLPDMPPDAPVDAPDDRVHDGAPCAPEGRIATAAHTEPPHAHGRAADTAEPGDRVRPSAAADPARGPLVRTPTVADQRLAREERVGARGSEAPATPLLVVAPDAAPAPVVRAPDAPSRAAPVELPAEAQVAAKVREIRLDEDGRHELTLDLHPAELGSVGVDVVVDGGTVHVALRAEQAPAAELLRSSLDELRQLLTESGLDVGDLSSHDGARHDHHHGGPEHGGDRAEPVVETFVRRTTPVDGVDVLL